MKKTWIRKKDGSQHTVEMTMEIQKTTRKEKMEALAAVVVIGIIWFAFFR